MGREFNRPALTGNELGYIKEVLESGHYSADGEFGRRCQEFCEKKWGFRKCFLTPSGTSGLEMAAMLAGIGAGDEVIVPSYTFPTTALAFVRQGARIVFIDSRSDHPCLDEELIESLITPRTKAIVAVHYGGVACDMDRIMELARSRGLVVIEDAAHSVGASYKSSPLGGIGHMGVFSFHETKNIHCGEGGMLMINDPRFLERAEMVRDKGTNRSAFFRGEVGKYECVEIGSSFLAPEMTAAFLLAQLEKVDELLAKRSQIWDGYFKGFASFPTINKPVMPEYAQHNAHVYFLLTNDLVQRDALISRMQSEGSSLRFHYQSLHQSPLFNGEHGDLNLPNSVKFSRRLVRLPLHVGLAMDDVSEIARGCGKFLTAPDI